MRIDSSVKVRIGSVAFVCVVAVLGSVLSARGIETWYDTLVRPSFTPAGAVIGAVWTTLFALLALAMIVSFEAAPRFLKRRLMLMLALNGLLNIGWSYVFFSLHRIDVAVFVAIALALSVLVLIVETLRYSRLAPLLLIPYFAWVCFASYLNATIVSLNEPLPFAPAPQGNGVEMKNDIQVLSPAPNELLTSPWHITGRARGSWFFEATFPVTLYDQSGKVLWRGPAHADDTWMTESFVPFSLTVFFDPVPHQNGTLVFEKDNPSGMSEFDKQLIVPVEL